MGVTGFDFNHLNNVLVSRDHQSVRLIDIDGNASESMDYYMEGSASEDSADQPPPPPPPGTPRKPSLEIDLVTELPRVISQLILGKGRGPAFVTNTGSQIWHARTPEDAKEVIMQVVRENFFSHVQGEEERVKAERHIRRVAEWFYAVYKKRDPWSTYTRDIYDAMRCIDHLPIS
mmetsp:Transcript_21320/g.43814  ORF Transcript_21320/g.43814 Transcript_21320/m.43814 type:complete len:175 (+) Transcript_21320:1748-2272(+)